MLSVNLSEAPTWLIGIGVVVALGSAVGEVVGQFVHEPPPPTVTVDECDDLCLGWVESWGPQACTCKFPESDPSPSTAKEVGR